MYDKKNILFSGHDFKFLTPLIELCERHPAYEVRMDKHRGHHIESAEYCEECSEWADIVFCEWALGNAVWYSKHKKPGQKIIVRLHLQEVQARLDFLWQIDWKAVDALVLICHSTFEWMQNEFEEIKDRSHIIYNPIDAMGTLNIPKTPQSDFNLGFVGIVPQRKRLDLAVELLIALKHIDKRYHLTVKGRRPEEYPWMLNRVDEMKWYNDVFSKIENSEHCNAVTFEPHGADMPAWYSKVGFILSTSDFEGSHQAVAEGMAAGAIPVIRNWEGAEKIYPAKYVFSTLDEAVEKIKHFKSRPEIYLEESRFCRQYAQDNFDQVHVCDKLMGLFASDVRIPKSSRIPITPLLLAYIPPNNRGGYRIRIEQEIKQLKAHGVDVVLACLHPATDPKLLEEHKNELALNGCVVECVECNNFFEMGLSTETARPTLERLEQIIRKHGVDIIHAEALYSARVAQFLKERTSECGFFFDCHGISPEEEEMSGASAARIKNSEAWEQIILQSADMNVFVSQAMRLHYKQKYNLTEIDSTIIPCCIEATKLEVSSSDSELTFPKERPAIGYVGTLAAWQCSDEMFMMFSQLHRENPDIYFVIIAPTEEHRKAHGAFRDMNISKQDYTVVALAHHQVAGALTHLDAGVLLRKDVPTNRVSSPTKYAEYLASGVPVIITDCVGDYSADVKSYDLGCIVELPSDKAKIFAPQEITKVANYVAEVAKERDKFAQKARAYLKDKLLWESHIELLMDNYERLKQSRR